MTAPTPIAVDVALAAQGRETRELTLSKDIRREVTQRWLNGSARSASHGRCRR
jgi:hypothetical protein